MAAAATLVISKEDHTAAAPFHSTYIKASRKNSLQTLFFWQTFIETPQKIAITNAEQNNRNMAPTQKK